MCFTSKRLQLGDFLKVKLSRLQVNTNHHKQTNQLPGATCFPSSCPLHNVGFFSDWEQTCRPSQVSFFDVVFFLTKGKPTNMSWWFGKDDDDRWGRQQTRILLTWSGFVGKIWPHKVLGHKSGACFFQSCDEQDVSHTPKTNMDSQNGGLKKMAPF